MKTMMARNSCHMNYSLATAQCLLVLIRQKHPPAEEEAGEQGDVEGVNLHILVMISRKSSAPDPLLLLLCIPHRRPSSSSSFIHPSVGIQLISDAVVGGGALKREIGEIGKSTGISSRAAGGGGECENKNSSPREH